MDRRCFASYWWFTEGGVIHLKELSVQRFIHAWLDLSRNKWLAFGAHNIFKAVQGSGVTFIDLTPSDLGVGRQDAEYEDGYGYGLYGSGTYGMPIQQLQDGALDPATTWDIDNFGEILIACHSDYGQE